MNVNVEYDDVVGVFVCVLEDGRRLALSSNSYQAALREAVWDMEEVGQYEYDED